MNILLAILLGSLFGFVLHRVGASNPQNIINMLRLTDFHLMKAILFGIAIASSLLFIGMLTGLIDYAHLSVKGMHWGVIAGGAILGVGWAIAGYCPGTGVAALGDGRKDAIFFVLGGLLGALLFTLMYTVMQDTFWLQTILAGKSTLAVTPNEEYPSIITVVPGVVVALVVAMLFGIIAWLLPKRESL